VRILLVDDHRLFRDAMRALLGGLSDAEIVGEAEDGEGAIAFVEEHAPDVVLMDISMPGLNGLEATRAILRVRPATKVVVLSMHADRRFVIEALRAGAAGYFLKSSSARDLGAGLRPTLAGGVIREYANLAEQPEDSAFSVLSDRERQVLQLLAEGLATKVVAARLDVSVKTVESHRAHIMAKLDLHSIAELTKYAIREGLTSID
jgi:DNA-binding NarL/FixJ family response regulator